MILDALTLFHVVLSLVGIASGFVVVYGLIASKRLDGWTALFLWTTVATSVTGFLFPVDRFLPSHGVGIVSLIVLAIAILARYRFRLAGGWRRTYVIAVFAVGDVRSRSVKRVGSAVGEGSVAVQLIHSVLAV
jgi:hypothetical protein